MGGSGTGWLSRVAGQLGNRLGQWEGPAKVTQPAGGWSWKGPIPIGCCTGPRSKGSPKFPHSQGCLERGQHREEEGKGRFGVWSVFS